jgi:Fur family transcriptional regulator, peroxide stress response regulator
LNNINDKLETFYNLCRQHGLKLTPQRIEIYKTLLASKEHPSAETVYKKIHQNLPNVSFDTVNRTLNTLCDVGAAFIVEGSGDVRRFDGNCENHQHYKCVKCKKIFDFSHENFDNIKVPEAITGEFKVLRATVYIEGLCKSCQEKKSTVNN